MDKADLDKAIVELVEDSWSKAGRPLLLSTLGALHGGQIARSARTHHTNLTEYIKTELADKLRILKNPENPTVTGVVPINKDTDALKEDDQIIQKFPKQNSDTSDRVRFHPIFWQAFRKPIEKDHKRFITTGPRLQFIDILETGSPPPKTIEITKEFVAAPTNLPSDYDETYSRIEKWHQVNNMPIDYFSAKNAAIRYKEISPSWKNNLLESLLTCLNDNDMRRINMPLDIIQKLLRTKL